MKKLDYRNGLIHEPSYKPSPGDHLAIYPYYLPDMTSVAELTPTQFALAYAKAIAMVGGVDIPADFLLNIFHRTCYEAKYTTGAVERPRDPYQFLIWQYDINCSHRVAAPHNIRKVMEGRTPREACIHLLLEEQQLPLIKKKDDETLVLAVGITDDTQGVIILTLSEGHSSRPLLHVWEMNDQIEIITAVTLGKGQAVPPQFLFQPFKTD